MREASTYVILRCCEGRLTGFFTCRFHHVCNLA
jgi:hypothetical protein